MTSNFDYYILAYPIAGTRWLHTDGETKNDKPQRAVFSFDPEHALLEKRQVELAMAIEEAQQLVPKPKLIVFTGFTWNYLYH